ncbi:MAG: CaiB/BaiF CoA transferase family protein [Candidatus Dormibacteraceae bacterium]
MADRTSGAGPLSHLRVLDVGTFVAAPFGATLLAEFGAEVIKVEQPGSGDSLRTLGEQKNGEALFWLQESRNKKTIACNLRDPEGQEIIRRLVANGFDIVFENFRPGTLERWGLGYEDLRRANRGLIMVRISGYGQTGPARNLPGFGRTAHAFGGLTYLSGFPDRPPVNPGSATIADYAAGLFAAFGALTAVEHRNATGEGQIIDVALYEALFRIMDNLAVTYSANGTVRERMGSATPLAAPHNHYPTAGDRWIAIACTNDRIFARLAELMGKPELASDQQFNSAQQRVAHRDAIDQLVSDWTCAQEMGELVHRLNQAEVPCSPIYSIADIFKDPQYRAREALIEVDHPTAGRMKMPAVIPRLSNSPGEVRWLGRALGEDTDAVLGGKLAMSREQLAGLRARGVIA